MLATRRCRTAAGAGIMSGVSSSPVGRPTRGTTGVNRLRRVDRWIARHPVLRRTDDPLVVDLGFGASATTPLELRARLAKARPDATVLGLEIDADRVARGALFGGPQRRRRRRLEIVDPASPRVTRR